MAVIYISSAKDAVDIARKLADELKSRQFEILGPVESLTTDADRKELLNKTSGADGYLVIVKGNARPSEWQEREWLAILDHATVMTKVIPLVVGYAEPPNFLKNWQHLRVPDDPKRWPKFVEVISGAFQPSRKPRSIPWRKKDLQERDQRFEGIANLARQLKSLGM